MKKILKTIITIIIALVLFIGTGGLLRYLLFDDVESYSRLLFHDLHHEEDNIDTLFVGSSHVRRSVNPLIIDEITGLHSFNCGTSGQWIDGSLAVIRDACRNNDVEQIYLDMYYSMLEADFQERISMAQTYLIADYLPWSVDKVRYLLHASDPKYYSNSFIVARRNWEKLVDTEYVADLYERKHEQTYLNYEWVDWESAYGDYYVARGFFTNDSSSESRQRWNSYAYSEIQNIDQISRKDGDWRQTLEQIVNYCASREIRLILYTTPEPEWTFIGKGNYQEYTDAIRSVAEEYDLPYYDFNLIKPEYFDDNDGSIFMDVDHMNSKGAGLFSTLLGKFIAGDLEGEDLFYSSLEEKLAEEEPRVYGVAVPWDGVHGESELYIIANRTEGIEYKLTAYSDQTGKKTLIRDFEENRYFRLPQEETGILIIQWRTEKGTEGQGIRLDY